MLSIFTPTFNRANTIERLYRSLCAQTRKDFEWIIVDDGSQDDTWNKVNRWITEKKIQIRYYYQENRGKPSAHNRGVQESNGEVFLCVDSDDYLTENAVDTVLREWGNVKNEGMVFKGKPIIGLLLKKRTETSIVTSWKKRIDYSTLREAYKKEGLIGDTALVYKTTIIKKYRFDFYPGEKFMPEAYLYDKLDGEGVLRFVNETIYYCEYLSDGYTKSIHKINANNPNGYKRFIMQRIMIQNEYKDLKSNISDIIRLISINYILHQSTYKDLQNCNGLSIISIFLQPVGYARYIRDYRKYT